MRRHVSPRDKEVSGMARRIPVREILSLRVSGPSVTAIAQTRPVSKTSVVGMFHSADEKGVAWCVTRGSFYYQPPSVMSTGDKYGVLCGCIR